MSKIIYMECTLNLISFRGTDIKPIIESGTTKNIDTLYYLILNN